MVIIWAIDYDCYHRYQEEHSKSNEVKGKNGCKIAQKCDKKSLPNLREDGDHVSERNITCSVDTRDGVDNSGDGEEGEDRGDD